MKQEEEVRIVRVTKTEFELSDGRIYPQVVELSNVPLRKGFKSRPKEQRRLRQAEN